MVPISSVCDLVVIWRLARCCFCVFKTQAQTHCHLIVISQSSSVLAGFALALLYQLWKRRDVFKKRGTDHASRNTFGYNAPDTYGVDDVKTDRKLNSRELMSQLKKERPGVRSSALNRGDGNGRDDLLSGDKPSSYPFAHKYLNRGGTSSKSKPSTSSLHKTAFDGYQLRDDNVGFARGSSSQASNYARVQKDIALDDEVDDIDLDD